MFVCENSDIPSSASQKKPDSIDIVIENESNCYGVRTKIALPNRIVHTFTPNSLLMNEALTKLNYSNAMFKKLINTETDDLTIGIKYKISALRCVDVKFFFKYINNCGDRQRSRVFPTIQILESNM